MKLNQVIDEPFHPEYNEEIQLAIHDRIHSLVYQETSPPTSMAALKKAMQIGYKLSVLFETTEQAISFLDKVKDFCETEGANQKCTQCRCVYYCDRFEEKEAEKEVGKGEEIEE